MGAFKVEVKLPELPDDSEVELQGFGLFKNGESKVVELTEEQAESFEGSHGVTLSEASPAELKAAEEPEVVPDESEEGGGES